MATGKDVLREVFEMNELLGHMLYGPYSEQYKEFDKALMDKENVKWVIPFTTNGPYGGDGSVGLANLECLDEMFDFVTREYWAYGTVQACIHIDALIDLAGDDLEGEVDEFEEFIDMLKGLLNYPLIDDEKMSEIERESLEEAFEDEFDFDRYVDRALEDVTCMQEDGDLDISARWLDDLLTQLEDCLCRFGKEEKELKGEMLQFIYENSLGTYEYNSTYIRMNDVEKALGPVYGIDWIRDYLLPHFLMMPVLYDEKQLDIWSAYVPGYESVKGIYESVNTHNWQHVVWKGRYEGGQTTWRCADCGQTMTFTMGTCLKSRFVCTFLYNDGGFAPCTQMKLPLDMQRCYSFPKLRTMGEF